MKNPTLLSSVQVPVRVLLLFVLILSGFIVPLDARAAAAPESAIKAQISFPAEINKDFSPISITAGGISRLRITIFNPNTFQLTNAAWADNLVGIQPGISIANPVNLTNTCGGTVVAPAGGTSLSLSGGIVPAQIGVTPGSCTVSIDVTSTTPGNLINTIPAGGLTATGGGGSITNTTPASATLNVSGIQTPTVSKSFNPGTIWVGQTSQLSIVIMNNQSNANLTQASLNDNLPANVFLANPVSPTLTGCGGSASLNAVAGGTSVTLNNATIAPNSTCTITVNVTSNVQGAYNNTIPANALQTQQGLTNATQTTARLNVDAIGMTKGFSPSPFSAGGTTTLTITLRNPTGTPYTGVSVSDTLPGTILTVVPGTATTTCGGTVSATLPRTVSLTGGTIPAGSPTTPGVCTISVQVTAPAGTPSSVFTNTIPAGALTTDQDVSNPRSASNIVNVAGTDVRGVKTFSPASITAGSNSRLRIDFFAPSDTNLTNFSMTDNLPAGVTVSNSTAPAISGCGAAPPRVFTAPTGATSISLTNGLILAGQRCRIDVYVTSITDGVHTNTIPPGNITNNENRVPVGNLTANLTVTGGANLAIDVVKGFNPLTVFGGSSSTMSIQLINPSNITLTGIAFTDNMPNGMILANPINLNVGTCGGTLAGTPGANTFSFSGGSLPPGGTCTLTLSATMTVNGNLTNTIPAGAVTTANGVTNPDPAAASLTNLPGASISKFFDPNPINIGGYSLLTIIIQNTGNIPLSGMGLIDNLPAGVVIAGAPAPAPVNNCGGTLTAIASTQLIQLINGSLSASSSCTIVVSVTGNTPGSYQNIMPAGSLTSNEGATNSQPAMDTLVIQGTPSGLTKAITATSLPATTGTNVAIGEIVTYQVDVVIPPGTYANATIVDTMERGLAFVGCDTINAPGLTTSVAGSFTSVCANPTTSDAGGGTPMDVDRSVTFGFGTLTNAGTSDVTLSITYRAIVLDISANIRGNALNNSVSWIWSGGSVGPAQTTVTVAEPQLTINKTANVNFVSVGSEVTFTLTLSHAQVSNSDAFDVVVTDVLPVGLDYVPNSLNCTIGAQDPDVECVFDNTNPAQPTIRAAWSVFTRNGGTGQIQFRVVGNSSIPQNGSVTNTANAEWTSMPGNQRTPQSFTPNVFSTERFYDPLSPINIYGTSSSLALNQLGAGGGGGGNNNNNNQANQNSNRGFIIPLTGFTPNTVTELNSASGPTYGPTSLLIEIPSLKVSAPIVGVQLKDGNWDVSWLLNQAGWLEGTAYPTWNGNSVLTAHAVNTDGKPGLFARLNKVRTGDYIFVYQSGYRYTYQIVSNGYVKPNDIKVLQHEEKAYITLLTCDTYDEKTGTYLRRVVVRAVLVDVSAVK